MDSVFTSPPPRVDFRLQHPPATTRLFCNTLHPPASHSTTRIAGISTTARERRSVIMSAPARGPEATPLLSVVETSERARGSQLASAASKKKFLAAVGAVALVGLAAAVSLDGGERFAATGSRLGASRAQRRKNARARRIRDGAVAAAGLAPKPDPSAPKVPVKFRVFTSCIDDRVRALAPAGFFDAAIADVRVVHHNYRTYGPENFFVWERGYETTPFDEASAYGSGFEVTTDLVDWEFGFALKNANGVEWYEIGVGEQGVKKGLAAVKAPLAGLNINGDDHAPGCAQVYGDYFNRAFTREEKEGGVISYVFGSCAETCAPPPPPPSPPPPSPSPPPPSPPPQAPQSIADLGQCINVDIHASNNPTTVDTESFAATETNNLWNFDHQGLYKISVPRALEASSAYFANTVSNDPEQMWFKNYRRTTSMSYTSGWIQINAQNTPRDQNQQWSSEAIGASRVDILKTSSLTASGTKLGAGVVYLGAGNSGQTSVTVEHNFDTTDYVVFAMVMNAKANNAPADYAISDGFGAHIFDKAATAFKVQYGRHSKYQGWGNSDYVLHWLAFKKSSNPSTAPGTVVAANVVDVPNTDAYRTGAYNTLCVKHDLGTSAYRCFAQVVAKTPSSEWTTSSNALFVVECEASENYVYFSMAYTGETNSDPVSSGNVDYTQLSIEYMLVRH